MQAHPALVAVMVLLAGCAVPVVSLPLTPTVVPSPSTSGLPSNEPSIRAAIERGERWIVYQGGSEPGGLTPLRLVRPDGRDDHLLIADALSVDDPAHPAWSPDGERIAFDLFLDSPATPGNDRVAIWLVDVDGSDAQELATCELPCLQLAYPAWSPDGESIALCRYEINDDGTWGPSTIEVPDVATGNRRQVVTSSGGEVGYYTPRWSPDGQSLVFGIETYEDATEAVITGATIAVVPVDGGDLTVLTDPALFGTTPDWVPADRIVFTVGMDKEVDANLMVMAHDGSDLGALTSFAADEARAFEPTWTPDGRRVMFTYNDATGTEMIAFIDPDGSDLEISSWSLNTPPVGAQRTHAHLRPG